MSLLVRLLCVTVAFCGGSAASATTDSQFWLNAGTTVKLSESWRLSEEITARFSDNRNGLYEIEANTLLGYRLSKKVTIWAGYTHDPQYAGGDFTTMEHRAREQVTFDNIAKVGPGNLSARLRTEQRWRGNADGTGWRVRPFVRYTIPFHQGGHAGVTLTSEPFFNLNTTAFQTKPGLDRVRNLIAVTAPLGKHFAAELGYLNQHIFLTHRPDESDNIAWVSLSGAF